MTPADMLSKGYSLFLPFQQVITWKSHGVAMSSEGFPSEVFRKERKGASGHGPLPVASIGKEHATFDGLAAAVPRWTPQHAKGADGPPPTHTHHTVFPNAKEGAWRLGTLSRAPLREMSSRYASPNLCFTLTCRTLSRCPDIYRAVVGQRRGRKRHIISPQRGKLVDAWPVPGLGKCGRRGMLTS